MNDPLPAYITDLIDELNQDDFCCMVMSAIADAYEENGYENEALGWRLAFTSGYNPYGNGNCYWWHMLNKNDEESSDMLPPAIYRRTLATFTDGQFGCIFKTRSEAFTILAEALAGEALSCPGDRPST